MNLRTPRNASRILDDLTNLRTISRQRKYQIRQMRKGLCIMCPRKAFKDTLFCVGHNKKRGIQHPGTHRKWR